MAVLKTLEGRKDYGSTKYLVGYSKPGITKIYTPATQSSVGSGPGKVDPTNRSVGPV